MMNPATLTDGLRSAIEQWRAIVGPEHVLTDPAVLRRAETATFATSARVPVVVRPQSRSEVQACLRVANAQRVAVYPVSTGKNWGYGSGVPASDNNVLMDLSRMTQIVDFDERLAYVTVEPGVTQRQLFDFLRAKRSLLWMDSTGASPDSSLIGNTLERGFGHTPYGDHFSHVCALEVVLASGEYLETGFARFAHAAAAPVSRWGLGPVLDGLFSQSNFGVVTRMTVWLMPAPEHFEAFFFQCENEAALAPVVEALRTLRLSGTLRSAVHLGNDYKVLNGLRQYPWEHTGGETPLGASDMMKFRKDLRFGVWNGSGGLYGTRRQVAEARRLVRRGLKSNVSKLAFVSRRTLSTAKRLGGMYHRVTGWDIRGALELVRPLFGLLQGVPSDKPIASAYWRKRTAIPPKPDPDADGCGLLWCAPVIPLDGAHATQLARVSTDTLLEHGFEPLISLTLLSERALTCVISISYDRHTGGEDERAMTCYRALSRRLVSHGYHPYRLGVQATNDLSVGLQSETYSTLLTALKRVLDPNAILAPGRYGIH